MSSPKPTNGSGFTAKKGFSVQKLAYLLITIVLLVWIAIIGSPVIIPLVFAFFFTFLSYPVCTRLERMFNRTLAIVLTFVVVTMPLVAAILLFVNQSIEVFSELPNLTDNLQQVLINGQLWMAETFGMEPMDTDDWLRENLGTFLDAPLSVVSTGLTSMTTVVASLFLVLIYTFLLLLYRSSIKNFFLIQFSAEQRADASIFVDDIQEVTQKYLYGLGLVMLILGVLNSIGLYLIGIQYAFFWGFLAAFLAIIPYVGTFIGGAMPFLYALVTTDTTWQPLTVVALFAVIQSIEGNLITPKIVGSSVKVNPLAAILSLLVGGAIWGVAGLIVALPAVAIVRVIFDRIDFLRPVSLLLSDELYERRDDFFTEFDRDRYRLSSFLRTGRIDGRNLAPRRPQTPPPSKNLKAVKPKVGKKNDPG